jgi:glycosyltransferase involved in cell wall biosynthesis
MKKLTVHARILRQAQDEREENFTAFNKEASPNYHINSNTLNSYNKYKKSARPELVEGYGRMKNKPTVVYILTKLELGGAQKVCLNLLEGLEASGTTAYLITGSEGKLLNKVKNKKNIIFLDSFKREVKNPFAEFKNFLELIKTLKQLKQKHPNIIVHTHSTKAGLLGRWAALFAGIKKRMHTVHGFGFHEYQNPFFWAINYACELVTSLITTDYVCVSAKDQTTGIKLLPRFASKSKVIRAAVDAEKFIAATKLKQNKIELFTFGTVACFKKQKNLFDLLEAFKAVNKKQPNTKLEIIGDGQLRDNIENWIKKNNLTVKITLLGWQTEVAPVMATWNAFALSSLWEGLPCAIIEARLLNLPVVAYNVGGISEVIKNGKNGFLIEPKNIAALSTAMLKLIDKPFDQKDIGLLPFYKQTMIQGHLELYAK